MATRINKYNRSDDYSRWNPYTKSFCNVASKPKTHVWSSFGCYDALSSVKKFCAKAGVPWRKLVDTQENMYLYKEKILKWNDSACQEAFLNAKNLFLAKEQGRSYVAKLPDPDLFVDKVDWDSDVNIERMLEDLEEIESNIGEGELETVVPEQHVPVPTGWELSDEGCRLVGMIVGY